MDANRFSSYEEKLERNVYGSLKGTIRMQLILHDLLDTFPQFSQNTLQVLDIGGGTGRFARICCGYSHQVTLIDTNPKMLEMAGLMCEKTKKCSKGQVHCLDQDFLSKEYSPDIKYDLVLMHGSAEWMGDPDEAIKKAASLVASGGILSLLMFNRDRHKLKQGINGRLLTPGFRSKKKKLTPPGARSPNDVENLLVKIGGVIQMISGIRVFYGFFRQNDTSHLRPEEWLEQEKQYYRKEPFSKLGEHTHFIWQCEE
jgi:S-adenosylmethionine-dependent methyltransferase